MHEPLKISDMVQMSECFELWRTFVSDIPCFSGVPQSRGPILHGRSDLESRQGCRPWLMSNFPVCFSVQVISEKPYPSFTSICFHFLGGQSQTTLSQHACTPSPIYKSYLLLHSPFCLPTFSLEVSTFLFSQELVVYHSLPVLAFLDLLLLWKSHSFCIFLTSIILVPDEEFPSLAVLPFVLSDKPMEHWRATCILPSNAPALPNVSSAPSRILQDTSGNAQSYALENAKGTEKSQPGGRHTLQEVPDSKYPFPPTLGSNVPLPADTHLGRLEHRRRHRTRVDLRAAHVPVDRSYLNSKKYLEYRARQRRDTGQDGEAIWPDELEEAFQDGLLTPLLSFMCLALTYKHLLQSLRWVGERSRSMARPAEGMSLLLIGSLRQPERDEHASRSPVTCKSSIAF